MSDLKGYIPSKKAEERKLRTKNEGKEKGRNDGRRKRRKKINFHRISMSLTMMPMTATIDNG